MTVDRSKKRYVDISGDDFGKRLRRCRHAAGFTRKQLAFESGVSERTIIKYESGKGKGAKDSTLLAVCTALDITLDDLLPPKKAPHTAAVAEPQRESAKPKVPWKGLLAASSALVVLISAWSFLTGSFSSQNAIGGEDTVTVGENLAPDFSTINASRYYAEGLENLKRLYRDEARENFRLALAHDSTHAMSYVMLLHPHIRGTRDESLRLIAKARENEHTLSPCDKLFLAAMEAIVEKDNSGAIDILEGLVEIDPRQTEVYRILAQLYRNRRDYPKAIGCLNAAVTADTSDGMSFNRLAYVYMTLGQYEKALSAVEKYGKLSPAEPNPYDTRGDILVRMGRIDEAIDCYKTALDHKKDFFPSLQNLGQIFLLNGDHARAERYYRELGEVEDNGARCRSNLFLACIALFEGKLDESLKKLDHCAGTDCNKLPESESCLSNEILKAHILCEKGKKGLALRNFEQATAVNFRSVGYGRLGRAMHYVQFLSAVDMNLAKAFVDSLKLKINKNREGQEYKYWFCRGWIELKDDKPEDAIVSLNRAAEGTNLFCIQYQLAMSYLEAHQSEKAIQAFEAALNTNTSERVRFALWSVKSHYYLGMALLENGEHAKAEAKFAEFLDMWKDADWECEEISEARKHLTYLSMNQGASK